jgi:hypothetical protein
MDDEPRLYPSRVSRTEMSDEYEVTDEAPRVFSRVLYGPRFPTPASMDVMKLKGGRRIASKVRSAAIVQFNGEEVLQLRDPYSLPTIKSRFEDSYRVDPIIRRGINLAAKFTLGKRTKVVVDMAEEFIDARFAEDDVDGMLTDDEVIQLKTRIEQVNWKVKFHEKLKAAVIQCKVYGRSALLIEKDENGFPIDLKVLNSRKLGTVYADPDTWELVAVEYEDREKTNPLRPDEIIYLTNQDFHVSPDSLYYGLSEIETIVHVSEANRLIDEEDLKEGNRGSWAHHGLIKFPPNVTDEEVEEFLANFYPGTWNGTSQDVVVETHNLNIAVTELVHERNENDKRILRGMGIPAFLIGFEDVTNRATTVAVLHAWRESELSDYRTWLQNLLEPQWFGMLAGLILPDKDWEKMKMKPRLEFEDITFDSLEEKVKSVMPLFQGGLISMHKALKMLDMEDEIEHIMETSEELDEIRKKELIVRERMNMRNLPKGNQSPFGAKSGTSGPVKPSQGATSKASPHDTGTAVSNINLGASQQGGKPKKRKGRKK